MTITVENINVQKVDWLIAAFNERRKQMIVSNQAILPTFFIRKNATVCIKGVFFKAVGRIEPEKNVLKLSVKLKTIYKIIFLLAFLFFLWVNISQDIKINGNSNPSILDRFYFVVIATVGLSILYLILLTQKKRFCIENEATSKYLKTDAISRSYLNLF